MIHQIAQVVEVSLLILVSVLAILSLLAWLQDNEEELLFLGVFVFVVVSFVLIFTSPIR